MMYNNPGNNMWPYNVIRWLCHLAFIFLQFVAPVPLFAQDIVNLQMEKVQEDGLSNNYIMCINQDKNGFIWFGTREGLFRYDGYTYKSFRHLPGDSTSISNNIIPCLYPEGKNLWIGSAGGLSCIDVGSQTLKNFKPPQPLLVNAILPKDNSDFWLATSAGLFEFSKTSLKWKRAGFLPENMLIASLCDDKGHLYIVPANHGFYCYTKSTGAVRFYNPYIPAYPITDKNTHTTLGHSYLATDGYLWLCTWGGGIIRFNTKTGRIKQWLQQTDDVHALPYKITADLLPDNNGHIWIANKEGGLTIFNPEKNEFTNYPVEWKSETDISGAVISLFRDKSGIYWIGTENGIFKYDPHNVHLSNIDILLKTDAGVAQAHISPTSLLKDKDGSWWMGMYEGIFIFDPKTHILQDYSKAFGLSENLPVFNILRGSSGAVWFTAGNRLVKVFKKIKGETTSFQVEIYQSPDIKSTMCTLYIDAENRIWVGTYSSGIFRFNPASKKFIACPYRKSDSWQASTQINAFQELSKDSLLIGAEQTGLLLLNTNNGVYKKIEWPGIPKNVSINAIYKSGGSLWIGTQDHGLWETDTRFKQPVIKTITDGLPSMSISNIAGGKQDNFWFLTISGAVEYQVATKKITIFDKKDGIQNFSHVYSIITNDDGSITIGGRGCIYNFNPAGVIKNNRSPNVYITSLKVFDKEYNTNKTQPIELDYNQNYFSLDYVALNYTHTRLNKYAYKMEGLDKKWNDAGSRRYVSYANLEEGTYTFNVKACNNEGVWNNTPARLVLVIHPPFWHRWWFYMIITVSIAGITYMAYTYNINQLKIRLQLRDKIARDLHDDIGSTLSSINIFSKIAMQKMYADKSGGLELIEKISANSQKTLDALSDIVWSINTRNDGMDNFLVKANEYLSMLEVQGIAYDFTIDPEIEILKLGMVLRKELYLIFKEAVCNASKYAGCSFIQINLTRHKNTCTLIIHDDGQGFDTNNVVSGNGIFNMQQRAKKMNGDFHIQSEKNKGTTVTLNFSFTQFR